MSRWENPDDSAAIAKRVSSESDAPQMGRRAMITLTRPGQVHVAPAVAAAEEESPQISGRRAVRPQLNAMPEMTRPNDSRVVADRVPMGVSGPQPYRRAMSTQVRSGHIMPFGCDVGSAERALLQTPPRRAIRPHVKSSQDTTRKD